MTIIRFFQSTEEVFKKPVKSIKKEKVHLTNEKLRLLMQDMIDTHFQGEKVGVGLAANQIGGQYALFLVYINDARAEREGCSSLSLTFWANATYIPISETVIKRDEYCFSLTGMKGKDVPRYHAVEVTGIKISVELGENRQIIGFNASEETMIVEGFQARLFQHECDHINPRQPLFFYDHLENGELSLEPLTEINDPRTFEQRI